MTTQPRAGVAASRRWTSATLSAGVVVAGVFFALALALELLGQESGTGEMTDLAGVLEGLVTLTPWAWAAAGAYAIVATPVLGLMVSAWEYWSANDRRTVSLALAVLAVLAVSVVVAVLR